MQDLSLEKFEEMTEKHDATIRRFEIIGEAPSQIDEDFKLKNPKVPWRDMVDFRNVLVHEYFGLKIERVREVIYEDLPKLRNQIAIILSEAK